mmetsp:Transcript_12225/g.30846  ORF Transcript_12225/g.30846 Transcript_12225/m.30846 type:complete len:80 (+) Transcript_12225:145-384(+)
MLMLQTIAGRADDAAEADSNAKDGAFKSGISADFAQPLGLMMAMLVPRDMVMKRWIQSAMRPREMIFKNEGSKWGNQES